MDNNGEEMEIDLLRLLTALWRKAWVIALATVIFGACCLVCTALFIKPKYKAEAMMYVNSSNIDC